MDGSVASQQTHVVATFCRTVFDRKLRGLATATNPIRGVLSRGTVTVSAAEKMAGRPIIVLGATSNTGRKRYDESNVSQYAATVRMTTNGTGISAKERITGTPEVAGRYDKYSSGVTPGKVDPDVSSLNQSRTATSE